MKTALITILSIFIAGQGFTQTATDLKQCISIYNVIALEHASYPVAFANTEKTKASNLPKYPHLVYDTRVITDQPDVLENPRKRNWPLQMHIGYLDLISEITWNKKRINFSHNQEDSTLVSFYTRNTIMSDLMFQDNLITHYAKSWYNNVKEGILAEGLFGAETSKIRWQREVVHIHYNEMEMPDSLSVFNEYAVGRHRDSLSIKGSLLTQTRVLEYLPAIHKISMVVTKKRRDGSPYIIRTIVQVKDRALEKWREDENHKHSYSKTIYGEDSYLALKVYSGKSADKVSLVTTYEYGESDCINKFTFERHREGEVKEVEIVELGPKLKKVNLNPENKKNYKWGILSKKTFDASGRLMREVSQEKLQGRWISDHSCRY